MHHQIVCSYITCQRLSVSVSWHHSSTCSVPSFERANIGRVPPNTANVLAKYEPTRQAFGIADTLTSHSRALLGAFVVDLVPFCASLSITVSQLDFPSWSAAIKFTSMISPVTRLNSNCGGRTNAKKKSQLHTTWRLVFMVWLTISIPIPVIRYTPTKHGGITSLR